MATWVTGDEVYGQAGYLRDWLEDHDAAYVLALRSCELLVTTDGGKQRADVLTAAVPVRAWRRCSVGAGAHGPREYDWARVPIRTSWRAGRGHWLLARRSISDPTELAYYVCYGPRRTRLRRPGLAGRHQSPDRKGGIGLGDHGMIGYTLPELRRLLIKLVLLGLHTADHVWHWSRRRHRTR